MRIRKRPLPPPPPPPPPSPPPLPAQTYADPCLKQGVGTGDQMPRRGDEMQGRGLLHPDGDPPREEPQSARHHGGWWWRGKRGPSHTRLLHDPPPSPDPHPKMKIPHLINGWCTPSGHLKENQEEEEEMDSEKIGGGEVNGGNKWSGSSSSSSSSSGAQLTMMISSSPPKEKTKARKPDCFTLGSTAAFNSDSDQSYMPPGRGGEKLGRVDGGRTKKRRSPSVLMEGSRCSRVNGRGWRCCQQTLVGYSLCEHHLGKGRLRSMNTVRGKSKKTTSAVQSVPQEQKQEQYQLAQEGEPFRKKKIGMVKARSISSLLGDSNGITTAAAAPPPDASGEAMSASASLDRFI